MGCLALGCREGGDPAQGVVDIAQHSTSGTSSTGPCSSVPASCCSRSDSAPSSASPSASTPPARHRLWIRSKPCATSSSGQNTRSASRTVHPESTLRLLKGKGIFLGTFFTPGSRKLTQGDYRDATTFLRQPNSAGPRGVDHAMRACSWVGRTSAAEVCITFMASRRQ